MFFFVFLQELNSPNERVQSPGPATAEHPDTSPPPAPQVHFSPSVLSPSPPPLPLSPLLSKRTGSPHESLLSLSGRGEVFSVEELGPAEAQLSQTGSVSSEGERFKDFQ